jgi:hypothetical protein
MRGGRFHRVYLLQPRDLERPSVAAYAPEWQRNLEINTAFVAQTRAYQELIFLEQIPNIQDFSRLWPLRAASGCGPSVVGPCHGHRDTSAQRVLKLQ